MAGNGIKLEARVGVVGGKNKYTLAEDKCIETAWNEGKGTKDIQKALADEGFVRSYNSVMYRVRHLQGKTSGSTEA